MVRVGRMEVEVEGGVLDGQEEVVVLDGPEEEEEEVAVLLHDLGEGEGILEAGEEEEVLDGLEEEVVALFDDPVEGAGILEAAVAAGSEVQEVDEDGLYQRAAGGGLSLEDVNALLCVEEMEVEDEDVLQVGVWVAPNLDRMAAFHHEDKVMMLVLLSEVLEGEPAHHRASL